MRDFPYSAILLLGGGLSANLRRLRLEICKIVEFSPPEDFIRNSKRVCHVHMEVILSAGRQEQLCPDPYKDFSFFQVNQVSEIILQVSDLHHSAFILSRI